MGPQGAQAKSLITNRKSEDEFSSTRSASTQVSKAPSLWELGESNSTAWSDYLGQDFSYAADVYTYKEVLKRMFYSSWLHQTQSCHAVLGDPFGVGSGVLQLNLIQPCNDAISAESKNG